MTLLVPAAVCAATSAPTDASLADGSLESSVWFDADQSTVVPVRVDSSSDDSLNRDSRWLPKPKRVKAASNPPALSSGFSLTNLLGWCLLLLIAVFVIGLVALIVSKAETPEMVQARSHANGHARLPSEQLAERIKHLPPELRRTDVDLRTEAERLMNEGQFDNAIILLFGHQLLLLDHVGMLRLSRGKTNRKYVRETAGTDRESAKLLGATVAAFERSYFGRHALSESEFAGLWNSNRDLENIAKNRTEVAA